jgi:hypothetical protein
MELFEKYKEEIVEDTKFDQINILEKQLMLPAVKHKWTARLIQQKIIKSNLEKRKKNIKEDIMKAFTEKGLPVGLPKASLNAKVESSETVKNIDDEIQNCNLIIDYLERVEKIMGSISYDFGTATKLISMENT